MNGETTLAVKAAAEITEQLARDQPHFAQIPQALIRDQTISRPARLLYGQFHSFAPNKRLAGLPTTYVSQRKLAKTMGCTIQSISCWQKELVVKGWIHVRRRGNNSSLVTLYPKPKKANHNGTR